MSGAVLTLTDVSKDFHSLLVEAERFLHGSIAR